MKKNLLLLSLVGIIALVGCVSRVDTAIKRKYEERTQLPLNAASVLIRYDFNPTVKQANNDHLFSRTLTKEVERWTHTRLKPVGQTGTVYVTVKDASIIESPSFANPEKFVGVLDVVISIVDPRGIVLAQGETKVKREKEAPRNITEEERNDLTRVLSIELVNAFDKQIEEAILKMSTVSSSINSIPMARPAIAAAPSA